ncbi:DNA-binding response OmpR family regulator [Actinoplanes lutulentus]|uniref:DNA-binding response OmpR family regulator n=1 Tax=Actinoplanes lutulentus TaxID=1287878 RepID=A0A327Z7A4_9ACTN|nr:response regulator transcription factor [Actinoplanes lutulentus]MBB2947077.1 DNA-binding response OmpR family regulator [Actinoplanes lutulentus]RAK30574.1 DNA-binding response OmpR family regulator [Actinoplanes lutulentus]
MSVDRHGLERRDHGHTRQRGHLLVIIPELDLRESLTGRLAAAGYAVTAVATGTDAMASLDERHFDLLIVDVEIPDLHDLARARPVLADRPPIICMTTCDALDLLLPELGTEVEDYVTKPCRIPELLARVHVQLRQPELRHRDLVLDEVVFQAWRGDRPLDVTPAEYRLLRHLLCNAGRVLSKEQLSESVWGEARGLNAIERLVSRLRQKVDATQPALIHTRRGFGYCLG